MSYKSRHNLYGHRKFKRDMGRRLRTLTRQHLRDAINFYSRELDKQLLAQGHVDIGGQVFSLCDPQRVPLFSPFMGTILNNA